MGVAILSLVVLGKFGLASALGAEEVGGKPLRRTCYALDGCSSYCVTHFLALLGWAASIETFVGIR